MDLLEKEAAGRGGRASLFPILGRKNVPELLRTETACPHLEQGSGQIAHHVAEEAVTGEAKGEMLWSGRISKAVSLEQGTHSTSSLGPGTVPRTYGLKGGKVMGTHQVI